MRKYRRHETEADSWVVHPPKKSNAVPILITCGVVFVLALLAYGASQVPPDNDWREKAAAIAQNAIAIDDANQIGDRNERVKQLGSMRDHCRETADIDEQPKTQNGAQDKEYIYRTCLNAGFVIPEKR